jgi:hypothetical protein
LIAYSGPLAKFLEQIPEPGRESPAQFTPEERLQFRNTVVAYRERMTGGAFIIHSPGDEESLGGGASRQGAVSPM